MNSLSNRNLIILFLAAFGVWIYAFRGYLSGELALVGDAVSYYDHIKFFTENLANGSYPIWDPVWRNGVSNEFFLRRIGSFNPFYLILVFTNKIGVPYLQAHLGFMFFYYFLGALGFFHIAKIMFNNDKDSAFLCFLLLLFSSLGTRIFDSYLVLLFTPMVWFFAFILRFYAQQTRFNMLGMLLSFMILVTTYIPFYFITILLTFVISILMIYTRESLYLLSLTLHFIKKNKIFSILCIIALLSSLVPGYMLYLESKQGDFVLPLRTQESVEGNTLTVKQQGLNQGGIVVPFIWNQLFSNLKEFKLETFYIPIFVYIVLLLGVISRANKKLIFLALWGFLIFLISINDASPIYQILYDHIFYFKYFRNFSFFLWISILPIFILFVGEQFRQLINIRLEKPLTQILMAVFLLAAHIAFYIFLKTKGHVLDGSHHSLKISFFVCLFYVLKKDRPLILGLLLFAAVIVQPFSVYKYMSHNVVKFEGQKNLYDQDYFDFTFVKRGSQNIKEVALSEAKKEPLQIYLSSKWYYALSQIMSKHIFSKYVRNTFYLYDNVVAQDDDNIDFNKLIYTFQTNLNNVFIPSGNKSFALNHSGQQAEIINQESEQFKMSKYTANVVEFTTNFPQRKFLVYTDTFHKEWQAFINNEPVEILRSNIAFKGIWIPKGEQTIRFRFGSAQRIWRNRLILLSFYTVFGALIFFYFTEKSKTIAPKSYV